MRFKLLGTEIYISFLFTAVICIMLAFDRTGLIFPTISAVFFHETGHLIAMYLSRCAPKQIRLIPSSVQITSALPLSHKSEAFIALSGPAVNILIFSALYFNYTVFKNEQVLYWALINLIIGGFNLLPITGLDGGTVLFSLLCRRLPIDKASLIMRIITLSAAIIVIFLGVYAAFRSNFNISFFIIGLYLIVISLVKL